MDILWIGGEGPKDVPQWAYLYLVTVLKEPSDDLTRLLCVQKVGFVDGKPVTFIRIYDLRTSEEALAVRDFVSLDQHPELILYEGYGERGSDRVHLERRKKPKPQPQ
ncbi:MAG: hypothetical protein V1849_00520 [Chloroflexota bacterium]